MRPHTKYSHMTDGELSRVAFIEARDDLSTELAWRLDRALDAILEAEDVIDEAGLQFTLVGIQ